MWQGPNFSRTSRLTPVTSIKKFDIKTAGRLQKSNTRGYQGQPARPMPEDLVQQGALYSAGAGGVSDSDSGGSAL